MRWRRCGGRFGEPVYYELHCDGRRLATVKPVKVQDGHTARTRWRWFSAPTWKSMSGGPNLYETAAQAKFAAMKAMRDAGVRP